MPNQCADCNPIGKGKVAKATMHCLKCDRDLCQNCARAHDGAVVLPEEKADG